MKIFSYDSPVVQFLSKVGDMVLLNLLFVVCAVPVVTIGAAQVGLFTAMRVLRDKEDDSSCIKAFFRGVASGFWRITGIWCAFLVLAVLLVGNVIGTIFYQNYDSNAPVGMAIAALCIFGALESLIVLFHARFCCTTWQLLKNVWLLLLAYPLRAVLLSALVWFPLAVVLMDIYLFVRLTPIFLLVYFSLAYSLCVWVMHKPFQRLVDISDEET